MQTLTAFNQTITVDRQGAILTEYKVDGGDILLPRQKIDGAMRGGSHVCVPNFGPGGKSDQPQHGYGRNVKWQFSLVNDNGIYLRYMQRHGDFAGLETILAYELFEFGLQTRLLCINHSEQDFHLAPGFHPYFNNQTGQSSFIFDGKEYDARNLAEMKPHRAKGDITIVELAHRRLRIRACWLNNFALWTASPDKYICIEPTLAGNAYTNGNLAKQDRLLAGSEAEYGFIILPYEGRDAFGDCEK